MNPSVFQKNSGIGKFFGLERGREYYEFPSKSIGLSAETFRRGTL